MIEHETDFGVYLQLDEVDFNQSDDSSFKRAIELLHLVADYNQVDIGRTIRGWRLRFDSVKDRTLFKDYVLLALLKECKGAQ